MTEKTNVRAIITDKLVVEKTKKTIEEWCTMPALTLFLPKGSPRTNLVQAVACSSVNGLLL